MHETLLRFIALRSSTGSAFWIDGRIGPEATRLQDHADIVYSIFLLGEWSRLHPDAAVQFSQYLSRLKLFGKPAGQLPAGYRNISAHLTAYLLGATRLLQRMGKAEPLPGLFSGWNKELLVDGRCLPRWPRVWSHHLWRVSHWIGGIPSILLSLSKSKQVEWADEEFLQATLDACEDKLIDPTDGLLKPYRAEVIQSLFRRLYRVRHDPDLAALGGVVHLLWVYHAIGRPYRATPALSKAVEHQLRRAPFMEAMPYCLDFDIVQLRRTLPMALTPEIAARGKQLTEDIVSFLRSPIPENYALHKLPGALATLHESALLSESTLVGGLGVPPIDIIKEAHWL